jgi:ABC-type uncharacterized transport system substrate-binding protein
MKRLLALALLLLPIPAWAHPHVFVDATVEVIFDDQNRATALRIGWTYDDLFSLMIIEDRGLDPDFDTVLTEAEVAELSGFDMQWEPGYPGDTYALMAGQPLALSQPKDVTASSADGKITSTHTRSFDAPLVIGSDPLVIQVYDPTYYSSYAIVGMPVLTGTTGCTAQVFEPDAAVAEAIYLDAVGQMDAQMLENGNFPEIGAAYAVEARVTCAAP